MILIKITAIALIFLLFYIFRKWFFKHNIFLLLLIPIIVIILYSDYFIKFSDDNSRQNKSAELKKWKEGHKDNFVDTNKNKSSKNSSKTLAKIGDVLYDTTFNVNSLKIHYKEILVALLEDEYSYDSTRVEMDVIDENNSLLQTITEDINAIGSPIDMKDWHTVLPKEGIFLDYNFDGNKDFALRVSNAPNNHAVNGYFYIYLFDPAENKFIKYDKELNNPLPNKDRKEVECEIVYSTAFPSTETEYYKWVNGELEITESIAYEQLYEQPQKNIVRTNETKTVYKNGKEISRTERIIENKIE